MCKLLSPRPGSRRGFTLIEFGLYVLLFTMFPLAGGQVLCQEKVSRPVKGTISHLITPVAEEYKKAGVIVWFGLANTEGIRIGNPKRVTVKVYKDAKVERLEGGKRVAAKPEDLKPGQAVELYDLAEETRIIDALLMGPRSIVIVGKGKP